MAPVDVDEPGKEKETVSWLLSEEMKLATQVQILAVNISLCANALEKGMNSYVLPAVMHK